MISLPLPFVVVLFLAFYLLRLLLEGKPLTATRLAFIGLVATCIVHGIGTGLVWSYDQAWLRPALPIVASLLPVITWVAFRLMAQGQKRLPLWQILLRLIPTAIIIPLSFTGSLLIDPIIILTFLFHGIELLRMGLSGPDAFKQAQLHHSPSAARAAKGAGALLILNTLVDISIIVDFQLYQGAHILSILSVISLVILVLLALVAATGTAAATEEENEEERAPTAPTNEATESHQEIATQVDQLLKDSKIYTDPNLTLVKIARKAGIPSRDISNAINRLHGMNVSQYVNGFRLNEACRLLETTDDSITNIHLDSGFQTKSNFNREFKRQFDCSPTQWRADRRKT